MDRPPTWASRVKRQGARVARRLRGEPIPPLARALRPYLDRPVVLVDVGAYRGTFHEAVRRACGVRAAVLIEPTPRCLAELRKKVGPSLAVVDAAVTDEDDATLPFFVNRFAETSSLLEARDMPELANIDTSLERRIEVRTVTLDRVYRDHDLTEVDLLKIDVQGAEDRVLDGARAALRRTRMVWIETSFKPLYHGSASFEDVHRRMTDAGFELRETSPGHRTPSGELLQADCLFVAPGLGPAATSGEGLPRAIAAGARSVARRLVHRLKPPPQERGAEPGAQRSWSQSGEDLIVAYLFRLLRVERPSYIDGGAHDPWLLSNTALLYRSGSRGINLEPNPALLDAFRRARPEDVNLCAALGARAGSMPLYVFADSMLSTCSEEAARRLERQGHRVTRKDEVPVETLLGIVDAHGGGRFPDYLNLDVEGLELQILAPLAGRADLPKILSIETAEYSPTGNGPKRRDLIDLVLSLGYAVYADTYLNTIFVRRDLWHL